jgi:hypothetical protein
MKPASKKLQGRNLSPRGAGIFGLQAGEDVKEVIDGKDEHRENC